MSMKEYDIFKSEIDHSVRYIEDMLISSKKDVGYVSVASKDHNEKQVIKITVEFEWEEE